MYSIAIIGVGALGMHHLESVLNSELALDIYVIDNNIEAVQNAINMNPKKISGGNDVNILPSTVDIAIIATSSAPRRKVFEQLINHCKTKYIIFEKVLFQRREDYFDVEMLLRKNNIESWVDCARREQASYKELKKRLDKADYFTVNVAGGDWGFACNSIHMLDLIQYLSGERTLKVNKMNLLPIIVESKRGGYKEIFGEISGEAGKCQNFSVSCYKDSSLPMTIDIVANNFKCAISETEEKAYYISEENNWKLQDKDFPLQYNSILTKNIVESIIVTGECNLPRYEESMELHLSFIEPLIRFFEKQGMEKGLCQ